jgi:hypothetical protein
MEKSRDKKIAELKEAGHTVAHNITDANLVKKHDEAFTPKKDEPKAPEKIKVIIHSNDRENDEPEVFASINGKAYQIKTGEEVEVSQSVINTLKNAVEIKHEAEMKDGEPTGKTKETKKPRYIVEKV